MNRAAALMAVSCFTVLVGCSSERPRSDLAGSADGGERPVRAAAPASAGGVPVAGEVRDAKEAAEDAARRILDATVSAAARLREAGRGAAQAVGFVEDRDKVADAAQAEADTPSSARN